MPSVCQCLQHFYGTATFHAASKNNAHMRNVACHRVTRSRVGPDAMARRKHTIIPWGASQGIKYCGGRILKMIAAMPCNVVNENDELTTTCDLK